MTVRYRYDEVVGCAALAPRGPQEEGEEYVSDHSDGNKESHIESAALYQPLEEASLGGHEGETSSPSGASAFCTMSMSRPCVRDASGGICDACYPREKHHHGGGHGKPQPKKKCPTGYSEIPLVHVCIRFEWPSGPSPAPSYGPYPEPPVPVGP
jgi:hypothetical protein